MSLTDALVFALIALVLLAEFWLWFRLVEPERTSPADEVARAIRQAKGDFRS